MPRRQPDTPTDPRISAAAPLRSIRGWSAAVAASVAIVVVVVLAAGLGWLVSHRSRSTTYQVSGSLRQVDLQIFSGQATIVGSGSSTLEVRRTDDYAFGRDARERRWLANGVLHITSSCPRIVLGSCAASYELAVPETVAVHVQTADGDVRMTGFSGNTTIGTRSGDIDVEAYCGFSLAATSGSGDLHIATACAPEHLELRTASGNAIALVPRGRYRIGASSGAGRPRVTGVRRDDDAPFTIDVHSSSGEASVEGGL